MMPLSLQGIKHSQGRTRTAEILALYLGGIGHKTIAKRLGISPRITRTILIESGVYQPGKLLPLRGQGKANCPIRKQNAFNHKARVAILSMRKRVRKCLRLRELKKRKIAKTPAERFSWQYKNVPAFRLKQLLRRRMKKVLNGTTKSGKSVALVGCSWIQLREHIQRQFRQGMCWGNSGTGVGKWHIDHRVPCAAFDLTKEDQQRTCFHFTNLRPLWSITNMKKADKITRRNAQTSLPL